MRERVVRCMFFPFLAPGGCRISSNGLSGSKEDVGQTLRNRQVCFCFDWVMSCLGVTAKLAVSEFAAAEKTVVRPDSGVRPRLIRSQGTEAMVECPGHSHRPSHPCNLVLQPGQPQQCP